MTGRSDGRARSIAGAGASFVTDEGRRLLDRHRLDSLAAIAAFAGGELVVAGGHRRVRRIVTEGATCYLKQSFRGGAGSWRDLLRSRSRRSSSRREAENTVRLASLGVAGPEVLAWGERIGFLGERFSFLLTRALPGRDLIDFLRATPARAARSDVASALADVLLRLARAGLVFEDLVPRHVFVAREPEGIAIRLLDLHRLAEAEPREAAARMLASLDLGLPQALVSSGARLAFGRLVASSMGADLRARTAELLAERSRRRRHVRTRLILPGAAPEDWHASEGAVFCRAEGRELVSRLGLDRAVAGEELRRAATEATGLGLELLVGDHGELREIRHGHEYLAGRVTMPEELAHRIERDRPGFLLRRRAPGSPLVQALRAGADPARLARELSELLRVLLPARLWPREGLVPALRVTADGALVYRPGPTGSRSPSAAGLRDALAAALAEAGLEAPAARAFAERIDARSRGLLGSDPERVEVPENERFR